MDGMITGISGELHTAETIDEILDEIEEREYLRLVEEHREFVRSMNRVYTYKKLVHCLIITLILIVSAGITYFVIPC
jgi:hypothetical protein